MPTLLTQGRLADEKLTALGLTLTQGGEPTFVPANPAAPEWNTAALGPEKLPFARRLVRQLLERLLPGAVAILSSGKQYPGEPIPRWCLGLYRRRNAPALWKNTQRLRLDQPIEAIADKNLAEKFIRTLADKLQLGAFVLPGYEQFESNLYRYGISTRTSLPKFSRAQQKFESREFPADQLAACEALLKPAGWLLPLEFKDANWHSEHWLTADLQEINLFPGDSPMGLRLPLNELSEGALFTTLTVEVKQNELTVFLPPLPSLDALQLLLQAIESVADQLDTPPITLVGYPPSFSAELESIAGVADPGVVEVNLPPCARYEDMDALVRTLYAAAEACGMKGCRFQFSGRKTGTGGGAHIIFGGPNLDNNPFLHRPHLLASILRFLQHHPSLSYLFTGMFTGPSSQAPRVDESAFEVPYELEISLRAMEAMSSPGDPVMIDALLRNLLLDWNGNTHRAETSVDKFHNPFAPNGRLGLVEFRAFEMMPTAEMLLAMNCLLRALAACFAEKPYTAPLKDWRGILHDRFALPHYLGEDLQEVIAYLNARGFSFEFDWFKPHLDFRFPVVNQFSIGDSQWELRQALEPWPVMGEQAGASGTFRTVDASTDRLQLRVANAGGRDYFAVVNGLRIPLLSAKDGSAVGAIRYRLINNPYGLQPHIWAHSPLEFHIVDAADGRILHSFQYLNWRRDAGGYQGLPQTDAEGRQRCDERVITLTQFIGQPATCRSVELPAAFPHTLDLRAY